MTPPEPPETGSNALPVPDWSSSAAAGTLDSRRSQLTALTILVLLCSGIVAAGYRYYRAQRENIEAGIQAQISAIADLKVQQVVAWRNERVADALLFSASPLLQAPPTPARDGQLRSWMETFRAHAGYSQVALLDPDGHALLNASDGTNAAASLLVPLVRRALESGEVVVSDPYSVPGGPTLIDVVAPLPPQQTGSAFRAVLLHIDASAFLLASVQSWPTPSPTAESLLVRADGDRVRFLHPLRHKRWVGEQFTLAFQENLPAALAARGAEGIRKGIDYRGVSVAAALKPVPGTRWALVAKVDNSEIYAPLGHQSRVTALVVGLLLAACLAAYGFFWHRQQNRFYRRQYRAERQRRALEERYARLRTYINDIVLLFDDQGRILEANDRAVATYGYTMEELLGLSILDLLDHSERASFDLRWENLAAHGSEVLEGLHRRRDGSTIPVEVSSRTFEVDGIRYRHSVIRDITERHRADRALRLATRATRVLSASNQAVIRGETRPGCSAISARPSLIPAAIRWHGSVSPNGTPAKPCASSPPKEPAWST